MKEKNLRLTTLIILTAIFILSGWAIVDAIDKYGREMVTIILLGWVFIYSGWRLTGILIKMMKGGVSK